MMPITRRSVLGLGVGMVVMRPRWILAEELLIDVELYESIAPYAVSALELREFAIEFLLEDVEGVITYIAEDFFFRRNLAFELTEHEFLHNREGAILYVDNIPRIGIETDFPVEYFDENIRMSQIQAIELLADQGLPIIPRPESIQPIHIPSIEPVDSENNPAENSNFYVLLSIVIETMGIAAIEGAIVAYLDDDHELRQDFEELLIQIGDHDWRRVAQSCDIVLRKLIASRIWRQLSRREQRRITFRLAVRFVPIVGWAYTGASLLIAIKRNYHRFSFA